MQRHEQDVYKRLTKIFVESYPPEHKKQGAMANILIRSSLFGIVERGRAKQLDNHPIPIQGGESITYKGPQLSQSDLDVFLILKKRFISNNEQPVETTTKEILKDMGLSGGRTDKIWLQKRIFALSEGRLYYKKQNPEYFDDELSSSGFRGNLIESVSWQDEFNDFSYTLHPKLKKLFASDHFTYLDLKVRKELKDTAKWLYNFHESNRNYFPMYLETLQKLTGSSAAKKNFRESVKAGYSQLQEKNIIEGFTINRKGLVTVFPKVHVPELAHKD